MLAEVKMSHSPIEEVRDILRRSFDRSGKDRRNALRTVQRALSLAVERGYKQSEQFMFYFRHPVMHTPRLTNKWIMSLFEYVSADEVCQLAALGSI